MENVYLHSTDSSYSATLSDKLGAGGEGTVYSLEGHTDICVKLYHKDKINTTLEKKLKAMLAHPPLDPTLSFGHYSICWPTHLVYASEDCTEFLGFAMPLIDKDVFKEYHLLCDKPGSTSSVCYRLENFGTGFTYLHMYAVALNLVTCVMNIHKAGHAIGDLNDKNILVSTKDSKLTVVDCDSFEIRDADAIRYDCNVYMPEFSAPEVIKREKIDDRQLSDRFSLAILIFKLLMLNTHPYASRGSSVEHLNTPEEKIMSGYYPYKEYENLDVRPPVYALPYYIIPPEISELFDRCFVEGQNNPEKRPTPEEWFNALKINYDTMYAYYKKNKTMCSENVLHVFPRHLEECPWCEMKDDYFPPNPVISAIEQKMREEVKKNLAYIDNLITQLAEDNQITLSEYNQLLANAARKNLTKKVVDDSMKQFLRKRVNCLVGDVPSISETNVYLGKILTGNEILTKTIQVKNNYMNYDIKILILSKNLNIKTTPMESIIKPGESVDILIESVNDKYGIKFRSIVKEIIKINCEIMSKNQKNDFLVHLTYYRDIFNNENMKLLLKVLNNPITILYGSFTYIMVVQIIILASFKNNIVSYNNGHWLTLFPAIVSFAMLLLKPNKVKYFKLLYILAIIISVVIFKVLLVNRWHISMTESFCYVTVFLQTLELFVLVAINMLLSRNDPKDLFLHYLLIIGIPFIYLILMWFSNIL